MKFVIAVAKTAASRNGPWITIALITTNLFVFLLFGHVDHVREQRLAQRGLTALVYFQQHPYLELKAPLDVLVHDYGVAPSPNASSLAARQSGHSNPFGRAVLNQQQSELDGKVSAFSQVADELSAASFGYVPRAGRLWTLATYQFIHCSWLHLIGNLCLLWLVGRQLERDWGRWLFAPFYLLAGAAAAVSHHLPAWHSAVPLVGASGAIAGCLGASILRDQSAGAGLGLQPTPRWRAWRSRTPPLIAIWFALELTQACLLPRREGATAHVAHVGGFLFGLLCAWGLRASGWRRHLV